MMNNLTLDYPQLNNPTFAFLLAITFGCNHPSNLMTGPEFRTFRKQYALGLRAVARDAEISHCYLYDIELGRRPLSNELLSLLTRSLTRLTQLTIKQP